MKKTVKRVLAAALSFVLSAAAGLTALADQINMPAAASVNESSFAAVLGTVSLADNNTERRTFTFDGTAEETAERLVARFIANNSTYYRENALKSEFQCFEVLRYVSEYSDVFAEGFSKQMAEGKAFSIADISQSGLEHYLSKGALEWRSCCDIFDPVLAIVSEPEFFKAALNGKETPEMIRRFYFEKTGKDTTIDLKVDKKPGVSGYTIIDRVLSEVTAELYGHTGTGASDTSDSGSDPADPVSKKLPRINQAARETITAYTLHGDPNASGNQAVYNTAVSGKAFNGTFYTDTYRQIREAAGKDQKYTVVVYLCGTDLEHGGKGLATGDIMHMLKSEYDIESANVLILAGGTSRWANTTMRQAGNNDINCCLYYLDTSALTEEAKDCLGTIDLKNSDTVITPDTLKLLANFNDVSMGDSELLLGFLDTAYDLFPADHYWLSLWNHGGGAASGICYPDVKEGETKKQLTVARIEEALHNSKICKDGDGFDIISCEACLMGGLELAYNLSPYAKYYIGSEDLTNDFVPYESYFSFFKNGTTASAFDLAVNASKAYIETHQSNILTTSTNTVFDLSVLSGCVESMNAFGNAMSALLENAEAREEAYQALKNAVSGSYYFGGTLTAASTEYADISYFLGRLTSSLAAAKENVPGGDAAIQSLYDTAITAAEKVKTSELIAYSAAYFKNNMMYEANGTKDKPLSFMDMRPYEDDDFLNLHGYTLSGASLFVPFRTIGYLGFDFEKAQGENYAPEYVSRDGDVSRYLSEAIFPGYAAFLRRYIDIANSEAEFEKIKGLNAALKENGYMNAVSTMEVVPYSYTSSEGKSCQDYVIRLNFKTEDDSLSDHPADAFLETVKGVAVQALRRDILLSDAGETTVDIVIASSGYMTPNIFISQNASVGSGDEASNGDALVIDTAMLDLIAYYLTGKSVSAGTEGRDAFDWGTVRDIGYYAECPGGKFNEGNSVILEGNVYDSEGNKVEKDKTSLLFKVRAEDTTTYDYVGYVYYDQENQCFMEFLEDDAENKSSKLELTHYMITKDADGKQQLTKVEDQGALRYAVQFDAGESITVQKKNVSAPREKDETGTAAENGSEHNRYAVGIQAADGTLTEFLPEDSGYADKEKYDSNDPVGEIVENSTDQGDDHNSDDPGYRAPVSASGADSEEVTVSETGTVSEEETVSETGTVSEAASASEDTSEADAETKNEEDDDSDNAESEASSEEAASDASGSTAEEQA